MQQVALMYDNPPAAALVRRRIIQQPLRTEPSFALIASEATATGELAERLKRTHPVIAYPSLSHFLAEPPRRDRWAGILVARSGAWDARLDGYVRGRRCLALFGLAEESYGWPEAVARVRDTGELEPWLEALNAPEPVLIRKERVKRTPRASVAPAQPKARTSQAPAATGEAVPQRGDDPAAAPQPRVKQVQLDLPRGGRKARQSSPRAGRVAERPQPAPAARPADLVRSILADYRGDRVTAAEARADREFAELAAELGLVRAFELLDEVRERARRLVRG